MMHGKEIVFIDKLIEMTQHGKLIWNAISPERIMNSSVEYVGVIYETALENMFIWIYERNYKYYYDETNFSWDKEVIVEIRDSQTKVLMQELKSNNTNELLQAINYKKLDRFYSNILKNTY
ncbi:hypothetical protein CH625_004155 [Haemophilus influenzae]|uniref:hypothetical protein n=1 Tax=Haemophilus influenzae TaxID=727 RepID=UPI0005AED040|nr:hypothetical protein [Haemophilus influenzae]AXP60824.1 hypothetical protein CH624_02440 [Haemophilus influenzae]KIP49668.1 hypothetical protein SU58_06035 [Haemophilus influenzae]MCK9681856.1 hypothetical protein [Haemophilus influenzae]RFN98030.1 hypothetical protein CH623_04975 [Haemophilus influenzae]